MMYSENVHIIFWTTGGHTSFTADSQKPNPLLYTKAQLIPCLTLWIIKIVNGY